MKKIKMVYCCGIECDYKNEVDVSLHTYFVVDQSKNSKGKIVLKLYNNAENIKKLHEVSRNADGSIINFVCKKYDDGEIFSTSPEDAILKKVTPMRESTETYMQQAEDEHDSEWLRESKRDHDILKFIENMVK